jgi:hypothetical protein
MVVSNYFICIAMVIDSYTIGEVVMYKCTFGSETFHSDKLADVQNWLEENKSVSEEEKITPNDDAVVGFYKDNPNGKD